MRFPLIAAVAVGSLVTLPAFAASTPSTAANGSSNGAMTAPDAASSMQVRHKILQDLSQDGFKNIHVAAESFLVHAENKQGEPVVMIINPDSVFSVTKVAANQSNGTDTMTNGTKTTKE